ncbi:hypothetical protein QQ045_000947 [Rhodiola kirilowii]
MHLKERSPHFSFCKRCFQGLIHLPCDKFWDHLKFPIPPFIPIVDLRMEDVNEIICYNGDDIRFRANLVLRIDSLVAFVPTLIFGVYLHEQKISYFLRPLRESPPKPFHEIPHYYHENVSMVNLCKLHGCGIREYPRRVFDAVLFSNEVEILTLRWKELYPYVTEFVLLESNSTFTGFPKPLVFASHREEFKFVEPRLTYGTIGGRFIKGENPFVEEAYQRVALDQLLRIAGITDDDLLIMSDVDEIPSRVVDTQLIS